MNAVGGEEADKKRSFGTEIKASVSRKCLGVSSQCGFLHVGRVNNNAKLLSHGLWLLQNYGTFMGDTSL